MALTDVEAVRLRIGLSNPDNPFYNIITDEEIEYWIEYTGSVEIASQRAAYCCMLALASIPTRERVGDVEVWNDISNAYRKALQEIANPNPGSSYLLSGLQPYAAGISWEDILANVSDPDVVQSVLNKVKQPLCLEACYVDNTNCTNI